MNPLIIVNCILMIALLVQICTNVQYVKDMREETRRLRNETKKLRKLNQELPVNLLANRLGPAWKQRGDGR